MPTHASITDSTQMHTGQFRTVAGNPNELQTSAGFAFELLINTDDDTIWYSTSTGADVWRQVIGSADRTLATMVAIPSSGVKHGTEGADTAVSWGWAGVIDSKDDTEDYQTDEVTDGSNEVMSWRFGHKAEDGGSKSYTFAFSIPNDFDSWATNGITVRHRLTAVNATDATLTIEAMDPATGTSFGTPKTATRSGVGSADGSYVDLSISGATLSTDYSAGDLLLLEIDLTGTGTGQNTIRVSEIKLEWNS